MPKRWAKLASSHEIAAIAAGQRGRITRRQLLELGLSPSAIDRYIQDGYLHREHRGVYMVGYVHDDREGRWLGAVLAVPDSALSYRSAGHHLRLLNWSWRTIEVTTTGGARSRAGILVHHAGCLDTLEHDGIRVTTPEQTILDLCTVLDNRDRERVIDNAVAKLQLDPDHIRAIPQSHPRHRGAAKLRATLDRHAPGTTTTRSTDEEAFLAFLRAHDLPTPLLNAPFELPSGSILIDAFYPDHRIAIEIDGRRHDDPLQQARDRQRDRELAGERIHSVRLRRSDFTPATAADLKALVSG